MNKNYCDILDRLILYRKMWGNTQEEMSKKFGVTQSHYSKIETGHKIISFRGLQNFEKNGGDSVYLLTGEQRVQGEIEDYISNCRTERGRIALFKIVVWLLQQGLEFSHNNENRSISKTYKSLKLAETELEESTVWKNIRRLEGISQATMAKRLDINIKRYGRIENMEVKPDAEILNTLYIEFGYSPLVILDCQQFYINEANKIWSDFASEIKIELEAVLKSALHLINKFENI